MVRLTAMAALLVMLAVLQGAGLLFPREERAKGLCDDRFRLESTVPADGRSDNATPAQAARLLQDYADRLVPCRTAELEAASTAHPELVAIVAGSYVRRDDNLLRLVTGRIAWKAWCDEDAAIAAWAQSRAGLFHDRLKSGSGIIFAGSGALQEAKASLRDWAERQRALLRQQSAIDPTARTRLTTCRYDGVVLQCTTS
jgi:hypothetical protein